MSAQDRPEESPLDGPWKVCARSLHKGDVLFRDGHVLRVESVEDDAALAGDVRTARCTIHCTRLDGLCGPDGPQTPHEFTVGSLLNLLVVHRHYEYTGVWWCRWYTQDTEMRAPFREWWTGSTSHEKPWFTCTGLVLAPNHRAAFAQVKAAYPDAIHSFTDEKPAGWRPDAAEGSRFR